MNDDDLFEVLKAEWRQQPVDMDRARALIARRERWLRVWTWFNSVGTLVAVVAAAWFIVAAWDGGDVLYLLGAAALLVALPLMLIEQWWLRRHRAADYLGTSDAILAQARRQAGVSLKVLNGCRLAGAILLACAMAVWVLHASAAVSLRAALLLSVVWTATAVLALVWQRWRRRRVEAELAECDRLAAELMGVN